MRIGSPPLCPELKLHLADDMTSLWESMERLPGAECLRPPLWSIAWPGGQAIARHLLDNPTLVTGRRVIDIGSGSGLCAIAAARAGAACVTANDIDPLACELTRANAALNSVRLNIEQQDLVGSDVTGYDVVLAADCWYEPHFAERVTPWLHRLARSGIAVLLGDKGRRHLPRQGLVPVAHYICPTSESLEPSALTSAKVWRFVSST